jgi:hypothetical protein
MENETNRINGVNRKLFNPIKNGVIAELTSTLLTYPLNTIKTNRQLNKIPGNLFKGIGYCIAAETINAIFFYGIYNWLKQTNNNTFVSGTAATLSGMGVSYPLFLNKKLAQVNKPINWSYRGFGACAFNMVPNVCINFALREHFNKRGIGLASGFLSTTITAILTNPIDTIATKIMTKEAIKFNKMLLLNGLSQRIVEKNITTGTKMFLFDYFMEQDRKNQLCQSSSGNNVS